jgi:large conductance mechanosensitive channel
MGLVKEFREFAMRGNVIDLAVGVVIGGAFGKIVSSLVENIFMTPLNLLTTKSGVSFNTLSLKYQGADVLKYGAFLQTVFEFLIIAFALFLVVKAMNTIKRKAETPAAPPPTPEDIVLLREIRDSLVKGSK